MTSAGKPFSRRTSTVDQVTDLVDSVKSYAKQETIAPIKGAGRWLAFGSLGALFLGMSMILVTVGVLRLSQFIGGHAMAGSWSFVHYFVALVVDGSLIYLAISRMSRRTLERN